MVEHNYLKRALFRLRWLGMSDRERYAYLWRQTRDSMSCEHRLHSRYAYLWNQLKETPYDGYGLISGRSVDTGVVLATASAKRRKEKVS